MRNLLRDLGCALSVFLVLSLFPFTSFSTQAELASLTKDHLRDLAVPARIELFDSISNQPTRPALKEEILTLLDSILEYANTDPNLQFAHYLLKLSDEKFANLQAQALNPKMRRWIYDALMIHYTLEKDPAFLQALSRLWESQLVSDMDVNKSDALEMVEWLVMQASRESYDLLLLMFEVDFSSKAQSHNALEVKRRIARALEHHPAHTEALTVLNSSAASRNQALAVQRLTKSLLHHFTQMRGNSQAFQAWSHSTAQVLRMYRIHSTALESTVHFLPTLPQKGPGIHLSPVKTTGMCQVIFLPRDLN